MKIVQEEVKKITKKDALERIVELFVENKFTKDNYMNAIKDREKQASFYIGNFIAIPHGSIEAKNDVLKTGLVIIRSQSPITWDGNKVHYVIGIASKTDEHMEILTNIAINFDSEEKVIDSLKKPLSSIIKELGWK